MAQNCRIPGHAGPVRREDFGGCGGAFRMAGAEKAARWSRQEPALCVFMPGAFLGAVSEIRASLPGSGAFGRRTERFVKMRFGGMGNIFVPQCLQYRKKACFYTPKSWKTFGG